MKNNKGVFFTLAILLILIPLIMLVSFYSTSSKTKMEDTNSKIRCDELHYFVEDVKKDLSRAGTIFGRRAAIYAIDFVVSAPGNPLINYTFDCNPLCGVDCQKIVYPVNGSEAAIAELALCGTLNGTNVTYMVNHTIKEWVKKIEMRSEEKNFRINMTIKEVKVAPIDSWNFSIIVDSEVSITDDTQICYYLGTNFKTMSNTSIIGLEDPLYTLGSKGLIIKYMYDCDQTTNLSKVITNASTGNGIANGKPMPYSDSELGSVANLEDYCNNKTAEKLAEEILVIDQGGTIGCTQKLLDCTNTSSAKHFAGIINQQANLLNCAYTIPYLSGAASQTFLGAECLYIKNNGSTHQLINGTNCQSANYSCYLPSNTTSYCAGCSGGCVNGPSFFDRLDGSYNLSDRYLNQSIENFNNSAIGMETFIDVYDIADHGITPYWNASRVDYLYWKNITGDGICQICSGGVPSFKLNCPHAKKYKLDTGC